MTETVTVERRSLPTAESRASRIAYLVFRSLVCWFTMAFTRLRIEGRENLPTTGAYVLAPIHRSYVDTPITACVSTRRIRFMGKQEIWKYPSLGWLVSALGAFPVNRGHADREALMKCISILQNGEPLTLFPEGERKDGPAVHPLFDGAAYVAARAGVPIIPIGIGGSARVMRRHAKFIHPHKVRVVIGEPIWVNDPEDRTPGSKRTSRHAVRSATERLSAELQRLFDEAQSRVG
ncbi:MAG TPA: lysophospholipid acyltransferase family protein [Ilumatobacteraceae bacterium]|nr:lysophospholipid acyltransferase family protein [Ilumatobacteraceae bacterium]